MIIAAWFTSEIVAHEDWAHRGLAFAIAAVWWWITSRDAIPDAIERGLENFARKHRR
jgi:hypothetical protein